MTVCNSTVLINLIKIGQADLMKNLYRQITITDIIRDEITKKDKFCENEIRVFNDLPGSYILVKKSTSVKNSDYTMERIHVCHYALR